MRNLLFLFGFCFLAFISVQAQEVIEESVIKAETESSDEVSTTEGESEPEVPEVPLDNTIKPSLTAEGSVELGEPFVVSAEGTKLASISGFGIPSYSWNFGTGDKTVFGENQSFVYEAPGLYKVRLNVTQGQLRETITHDVLVYEDKAILLTDSLGESLPAIKAQAAERGTWLEVITLTGDSTGLSAEDQVVNQLQENFDFLSEAQAIIFYTRSSDGVQSFAQFWSRLSEDRRFDIDEKILVQISNGSLSSVIRLTQPAFEILQPDAIYLTRVEALNPLFETMDLEPWRGQVLGRGIELKRVDERSRTPWYLPFSRILNDFVANGISPNVIYLLLSVPFIAFVISFARQLVGISTFGVLSPIMLTLSFLVLGLSFGLFVFVMVLLVSFCIRVIFDRVELMYIPKVSLLLSTLALSFFLILGVAVYMDTTLDLSLTIFPMMVMSSISEKFLSSQSAEGMKNALIAAIETVIVSLAAYFFVEWDFVRSAVLGRPELLFLPIIATVWLGRFTGLRVTEYLKFRSLLNEDSQEE